MNRTVSRPVSALVFALAVGIIPWSTLCAIEPTQLTPSQFAAIKAQEPVRTVQANASLLQLRNQLGLDARANFTPRMVTTNTQGRTVVRFQQTHEGRRVWAGEAIVHVEAGGQVKTYTQGVKTGVALSSGTQRLSPDQAREIAVRNLAAKGRMSEAPRVELVAFPTKFTGGFATRFDAGKKAAVLDREMSVWAKTPSADYVWAYEVKTLLMNRLDGHKEINFMIDANTGAILRKWSAVQGAAPATGVGNSYYRGSVNLSTAQAVDGTFSLNATDRGTLPQPYIAAQGGNQIGLMTYYMFENLDPGSPGYGNIEFEPYAFHAGNIWGDGTLAPFAWDFNLGGGLFDFSADGLKATLQGALSPAGETTAVDAHFGLSQTWDFYRNVFGRDGIDGLGTSTFAIVHAIQATWAGAGPFADNAFWAPWYFGMEFGDGSYPADPNGFIALTELDITGHELTHGVTESSAGLIYEGQSGGLNEGNSDFFGKMVQAYVEGGATGNAIPDFPAGDLTKWEVGKLSSPGHPLRSMYKPSLDGISADGWYDGMDTLNVHFSSGVANRCLFFLAAGASASTDSVTYSPYLPGGMTGIGNDKTARIWYKTLTERLTPDADFEAARAASIVAAQELYGAGSTEETAVMKAWAAVNVGSAPGQGPRVRVSFPVIHPEGSFLDLNVVPSGLFRKVQLFPTKARVLVSARVENTANTKLTFSAPVWTANGFSEAGIINPDGTWTTPSFPFYEDLLDIKATSQADPAQFAKTRVLLIPADADTDGETDALDLGATAMSWGLPQTPNPSAWVAGSGNDWDIIFLSEALTNAFPVY